MMKIAVFSDIHNEFEYWFPGKVEADVVVLAGDIHINCKSIGFAKKFSQPVIFIAGNHEYYGSEFHKTNEMMKEDSKNTNIHFLLNGSVKIADTLFIGGTLWTDFMLLGKELRDKCIFEAAVKMNDFHKIKFFDGNKYRKLKPSDTIKMHEETLKFFKDEIIQSDAEKIVVVSHHAPSSLSEQDEFKGGYLSSAFNSNLDDFIKSSTIDLWIHGHTHHNVDYMLGNTRVITNQRGYAGYDLCKNFNEELIIDI